MISKEFKQRLCALSVFIGMGHMPKYIPDSEPQCEDAHYRCSRCDKYLASAYF